MRRLIDSGRVWRWWWSTPRRAPCVAEFGVVLVSDLLKMTHACTVAALVVDVLAGCDGPLQDHHCEELVHAHLHMSPFESEVDRRVAIVFPPVTIPDAAQGEHRPRLEVGVALQAHYEPLAILGHGQQQSLPAEPGVAWRAGAVGQGSECLATVAEWACGVVADLCHHRLADAPIALGAVVEDADYCVRIFLLGRVELGDLV